MLTGLSINQIADTGVSIPDLNARHGLNDMIRSYEEGKKT